MVRIAGGATLGGLVLLAALGPVEVAVGLSRLAGLAVATVGAWLIVARVGVIDLSLGASVGAGAVAGGLVAGEAGWPILLTLPAAAGAGALVSAMSLALVSRTGRVIGALVTLAVGTALVAGAVASSSLGGGGGFHAVPLLGGSDRVAAVMGVMLVAVAVAMAWWTAGHPRSSDAALAAAAPQVLAAEGTLPALPLARIGLAAGALLGLGGAMVAAATGSVVAAAYGLDLTAALALAAIIGGTRHPVMAVAGALLVLGPGTRWPLAPVIGTAPPLLATAPIGLALMALRSRSGSASVLRPTGRAQIRRRHDVGENGDVVLEVGGLQLVRGEELSLGLRAGEVVALTGPNGVGKSTALARIAGQLPDQGRVSSAGARLPRGVAARARAGLGRSWQHPPDVDAADINPRDPSRIAAEAASLFDGLTDPVAIRAAAVLVRLAQRRPRVALLDEPGAHLPPEAVVRYLGLLARDGCAVLVVEHRPEVIGAADRVLAVGGGVDG